MYCTGVKLLDLSLLKSQESESEYLFLVAPQHFGLSTLYPSDFHFYSGTISELIKYH